MIHPSDDGLNFATALTEKRLCEILVDETIEAVDWAVDQYERAK
jgi:hypothetical protein